MLVLSVLSNLPKGQVELKSWTRKTEDSLDKCISIFSFFLLCLCKSNSFYICCFYLSVNHPGNAEFVIDLRTATDVVYYSKHNYFQNLHSELNTRYMYVYYSKVKLTNFMILSVTTASATLQENINL